MDGLAERLSELPKGISAVHLANQSGWTQRSILFPQNLVGRIAEVPPEVPADSFYERIKLMIAKKQLLIMAKETLSLKIRGLNDKEINDQGLIYRLGGAIEKRTYRDPGMRVNWYTGIPVLFGGNHCITRVIDVPSERTRAA